MRLPKPYSLRALLVAGALFSGLPAQAQTDLNLAEAQRLLKAGQPTQALSRADAHIAAKPREPQGRFLKGLILAELKRTAEAIAVFRKLTEDFPELPEPFNNLAVLYAQEKHYDKARQALESAIKTHPSYSVAHENLGDVYSKLASQAYGKALQIDSNNPAAQNKLALISDLISVTTRQSPRPAEIAKPVAEPPPLAAIESPRPTSSAAAPPTAVISTPPPAVVLAAPAKPATPVAPVKAASSDDPAKAVHAWAAAWSKKDVKGYIAAYIPDYAPRGTSHKGWEAERASRLTKPGNIQVTLDKVQVSLQGNEKASVKFRQHYKSENLSSSTTKTLVLIRNSERWLINEERVN